MFFSELTEIKTVRGNLSCSESGSGNTNSSSDGEFVLLCNITGGTGAYKGASGYLQRVGTSSGIGTPANVTVPQSGEGTYQGKIILP
ncbi:MAG: hypothetical protein ACRD3A_10780 [Terriglobales bacterium]